MVCEQTLYCREIFVSDFDANGSRQKAVQVQSAQSCDLGAFHIQTEEVKIWRCTTFRQHIGQRTHRCLYNLFQRRQALSFKPCIGTCMFRGIISEGTADHGHEAGMAQADSSAGIFRSAENTGDHDRLFAALLAAPGKLRQRLNQHTAPALQPGEIVGIALLDSIIGTGFDKPPAMAWQQAFKFFIQLVQGRA